MFLKSTTSISDVRTGASFRGCTYIDLQVLCGGMKVWGWRSVKEGIQISVPVNYMYSPAEVMGKVTWHPFLFVFLRLLCRRVIIPMFFRAPIRTFVSDPGIPFACDQLARSSAQEYLLGVMHSHDYKVFKLWD